jgi:ferric-dicitrate binding protein FerR (iron transport regulator)
MTTASVTPPVPPQERPTPPAGSPEGPRRPASRVIALLTIALGTAVVLGTIVSSVFATLSLSTRHSETRTVGVAGVTDLAVDAAAADLMIVFDDVDEASLRVIDTANVGWTFDVAGDTLRVASPSRPFGWFFGGNGRATLTLPSSLAGTDATLVLGAGRLTADGEFGELDVELAAGNLTISGAARSVDVSVSAGSADLTLDDVEEADFSLSAGDTTARLTGTAPTETTVDVSAGGLDLTVPDVTYAVRTNVDAGRLDTGSLRTSGSSSRTIDVHLSAGNLAITGAD